MASKRDKALFVRAAAFVFIIGALVVGITMISSNSATGSSILGMPKGAFFGLAGMVLLVVVAFAASKILFRNLPPYDMDEDSVSRYGENVSSPASGKMIELKYADLKPPKKRVAPFDEYFGTKK